jgi:hypothetical protein
VPVRSPSSEAHRTSMAILPCPAQRFHEAPTAAAASAVRAATA